MSWLVLSLLCAFSVASADAATKRFFTGADIWDIAAVRFVVPGLLLSPLLMLQPLPPLTYEFYLWLGCLVPLDLLALLLYVRAITIAPLSHTLPYLALTPVFSILAAYLLLGERIPPAGALGVALVTAGAYLLNNDFGGVGPRDYLMPFRFIARERGPRLMLVVALLFSVTSALGKGVLNHVPGYTFGPFYALVIGLTTWAVIASRGHSVLGAIRARPMGAALVSLAIAASICAHFAAIALIEVPYMIAVKRTSMLFGLLYGALLFRESRLPQNLAAVLVMLIGVACIVRS